MKWRDGPVSLHISTHSYFGIPELGYTAVRSYDAEGRERWSYIHRLNAIAWFFDPEEHDSPLDVLEPVEVDGELEDVHIHHEDSCPLSNGEDNLVVLPESEHNDETNYGPSRPWFQLEDLVDQLEASESPPVAVADGGQP